MKISYFFAYILIRCLGILPYRILYFLGFCSGNIFWQLSNRDRNVAIRNIELCFPTLSKKAQYQRAKKSIIHSAINAFEYTWAWHNRYPIINKRIKEVEGKSLFDAAEKAETGTIYLLGHFGHWDIMGDYFGYHCDNPSFLGRAFGIPIIDNYIKAGRERSGGTIYPCTKKGLQELYKATSDGRSTGILADQESSRKFGLFAPFFGIQAMTSLLVQDMVQKTGAKVIMTALKRLPKGQGFKLYFFEPDPEVYSDDMPTATAALNRSYESLIQIAPEQYTWNYKRFSKRPEGEKKLYGKKP